MIADTNGSATDSGGLTTREGLRLYIGAEAPIVGQRVWLPIGWR